MKIQKFLSQSPIFALYRAHADIVETFQERLERHEVHLLQGLILTALFFEEREVRPSELVKELETERSTISHAIRGLEKAGLLKRAMHPSDARGYLLALTSSGKRKTPALIKEFDLVQDRLEEELGARRIRVTIQEINRLRQAHAMLES